MHHRRTNLLQIFAILGLMLLCLSGCKYERSFMNMDSNSGSPFFGLQLAVDSGSRPPVGREPAKDGIRGNLSGLRDPRVPARKDSVTPSGSPILLTHSAAAKSHGFVRTSDAGELKTNVRYSLQAAPTDKSLQTQAIDLRLSAF